MNQRTVKSQAWLHTPQVIYILGHERIYANLTYSGSLIIAYALSLSYIAIFLPTTKLTEK